MADAPTPASPIDLSQTPLEDVYNYLQCDASGLTTLEAASRLEQFRQDSQEKSKGEGHMATQFLSSLSNPICWMLEASAIGWLGLSSGRNRPPDWPTFFGILVLLGVNSAVGVLAERRAFRAASSLKRLTTFVPVKVKRDGLWLEIDASHLVPGDTIVLRKKDVVPADCRLTAGPLYIDTSQTDGLSTSVDGMCFRGQQVTSGESEAIVITRCDLAAPSSVRAQFDGSPTSLHATVAQIGAFCLALVCIFLVTEVLVLYSAFHYSYHRGIRAVFVLLIGSIPIALPTAVNLALSIGVAELASHEILTTRVAAVEELARVTVLCVDRGATLTEEHRAIGNVATYGPFSAPEVILMAAYAQSTAPNSSGRSMRQHNDEYYGGPPAGHPDIEIVHYKSLSYVDGPIQVTYRTKGSTQLKRVAKGMTGHVIEMCTRNRTNALEDRLEADVEEFANRGMSVWALAYEELEDGSDPEAGGDGFEFIAVIGFCQPLREYAGRAVALALALGVHMKLVTTTYLSIAKETGRQVGLGDNMVPAKVFKEGSYQGRPLDVLVLEAAGFAGLFSSHKRQLLQRLQHMGEFCAMISVYFESAFASGLPLIFLGKGNNIVGSTADVSITVNGGGDLITQQPCLPRVVDAIRCSRQIFRRLRGSFIYMCAISVRTVLSFSLLAFTYQIDFPPFMILLLSVATNIAVLSLSVERAAPGTKPGRWNLTEIFSYSMAYGMFMALSTLFFVLATEANFFQRHFGLTLSPSQPRHDNQANMLIFLQVAQISLALVFNVRSERSFFTDRRPSILLLGVFCGAQIISSIIAAYGNWEFAQVCSVDAGWIALVWIWNIIWFLLLDCVKLGIGCVLRYFELPTQYEVRRTPVPNVV
ncbi:plasma membrane ATPase [Mycena vitilis]|nr:plasma membrane ATPase [Mycena vitilis]